MTVRRADIERGSLYTLDPAGGLHLLRPFVIAQMWSMCRTLSTFHVDKTTHDQTTLKSFENGHLMVSRTITGALISTGLLSREGTGSPPGNM